MHGNSNIKFVGTFLTRHISEICVLVYRCENLKY